MSDTDFKIPKSLREALKEREVVPFVGAGVSMTVKKKNDDGTQSTQSLFPSWKGFVETLAAALREDNKTAEADYVLSSVKIAKPKYLDALQHAQEQLGEREWYRLFDESFDKKKEAADENSLRLNELIWQLANNLIITTNVDRVFQWTCSQPSEFTYLDVQNVEYSRLLKEKSQKDPTVWHLHGHIKNKENVIFTREQFESFYKLKDNEAKLKTLIDFIQYRTLLFIGFSLDDAYLLEQIEYIHQIYKGAADSLYILFREKDIPTANFPEYVKPIPFSEFGKPLEDLVEELARIAKGDDDNGNGNSGDGKTNSRDDSRSTTKKSFFNIPFGSKGTEFVGRKGKIKDIWTQLNKDGCASIGQAVNVKGFGGLGKTQLAVEYAHEKRGEYKNGVFWMVADQPVDVQLLTIGDELGWTANVSETVNQLDAAKAGFRSLSDCLILFDNVESYDEIKDYLPKADAQTHILITSRERIPQFHQIDLELLEREESRKLLLKISKRVPNDKTELESLEKILETLGDIPLAVELVGGYLAEHELVTLKKYHQFLDEVPLDKLEKEFPEGSFTNHDRSIIQTLRISEKTIKEKPLMVEILKVLAWSGSSSMGISLLKELVEAQTDFDFENALSEAHKLRLLKKDEDGERFAIHRLLAKVIQFENPLDENNEWCEKTVTNLQFWFNERNHKFEFLTEYESEIEHLEVWQKEVVNILPEISILLLSLIGNVPLQRGIYQMAFNYFEESLNLYHQKNLLNLSSLAFLQNEIGRCLNLLGKSDVALKYQLKSLETYRELYGEKHSNTATVLNNVGYSYGKLGKHEEALKYQLQSLDIYRELFGDKNGETAMTLNNVGYSYGVLGKKEEGLKYLTQSLKLCHELFGEKHPYTVTLLNNIGNSYVDLNNPEEALKYLIQSLEIHQEILGKQHPNTIIIAGNVVNTYLKLGDNEKAGRKATEFFDDIPQNHPSKLWFEEISRPYRDNKDAS